MARNQTFSPENDWFAPPWSPARLQRSGGIVHSLSARRTVAPWYYRRGLGVTATELSSQGHAAVGMKFDPVDEAARV